MSIVSTEDIIANKEEVIRNQKKGLGDFIMYFSDYSTASLEAKFVKKKNHEKFKMNGCIFLEKIGDLEKYKVDGSIGSALLACKANLFVYSFFREPENELRDLMVWPAKELKEWWAENKDAYPDFTVHNSDWITVGSKVPVSDIKVEQVPKYKIFS